MTAFSQLQGLRAQIAGAHLFAAGLLALLALPALAATTTTVTSSANPSNYSQSITLTATLTGAVGPTGTVTFMDGAATLGTGTVDPNLKTATYVTATLGAGTHPITAAYSGDLANSASTSVIFNQLVNPHGTATAVTVSGTPVLYGTIVGLTVTVTGAMPTGSVSFKDGANVIGTVTLVSGTASLAVSTFTVGTHPITAVYAGDGNNLTSTSAISNVVVNLGITTTALVSGTNPAAFGVSITLTATVSGGQASGGTVQFRDSNTLLGTVALVGNSANMQISSLAIGTHNLNAIFSGDANRLGSTGNLSEVITAAISTATITSSINPSLSGQAVTFTSTIKGNAPTGNVTFLDGGAPLTVVPLGGGVASYTTSTLKSGLHAITVTYAGDANNTASNSQAVNQLVNQLPVMIASSQNPSSSGQSVSFTVTVNGAGPTGSVTVFDNGNSLGDVALAGGVAVFATGNLAVGVHTINSRYNGDANNPSGFSPNLTQTVSGTASPQTGLWWSPAEGGRGYTIEQHGGNLFMATYLYDASGRATWYGLGPGPIVGGTFQGNLLSYSGGQTLTGAYMSPAQTATPGFATVSFSSPTQATLSWPGGTISLQKFDFGPGGSAATQAAGTPEAGWWWAPSEGGRGYSIEIQGGQMFLAAYMYDSSGNPVWYASGPAAMTGVATYQGTWQQYGNGQTLTGTWHPSQVTNANVGNITIQFSSTTTGTLTFPDGRQVAIQRFQF